MAKIITVTGFTGSGPYQLTVDSTTTVSATWFFADNVGHVYYIQSIDSSVLMTITDTVTPDAPVGAPTIGLGSVYAPTSKIQLSQMPTTAPAWGAVLNRDLRVLDGNFAPVLGPFANQAALPALAADGAIAVTLDIDAFWIFHLGSSTWIKTAVNTNTGDVTLTAVGSSPNSNGASLSGQVLTLQPADATHPGLISTVAQTLAGAKTFSNTPIFSALSTGLLHSDSGGNLTSSLVALSDMSNLAANSIIGNNTGSPTTPIALTTSQVKTLLGYYTSGDSPSFNTLTLTTALSITNGGTGQVTANAAFNALAPSQTGQSGNYLTTNGTNTSWVTVAPGISIVGAFSGSSQTNGASISGSTITFGPADTSNPGMVTTGTQTFAGAKTFNSSVAAGASSANSMTLAGAVTTSNPSITVSGSDTNIGLALALKGTGNGGIVITGPGNTNVALSIPSNSYLDFSGGAGTSYLQYQSATGLLTSNISFNIFGNCRLNSPSSMVTFTGYVNNPQIAGGSTGNPGTFTMTGADANISVKLVNKGAAPTISSTGWQGKRTTVADTIYSVLAGDWIVAYTSLTAPRTVTLFAPAAGNIGQEIVISDESGNAGSQTITIASASGSVFGVSTITSNYGQVRLYSNGTNWYGK